MPSLVPIKFRTELAKQFHRSITNTINVPDLDSLTTIQDTIFTYTSVAGQTTFSGSDDNGEILSYVVGRINVFLDGEKLGTGDYIANSGTSVILTTPASAGQVVSILPLELYVYPNPSDFYHVFLGRTIPWENGQDGVAAPIPTDIRKLESETTRNILGIKRITPSDIAFLIPRINWAENTIYTAYTDDLDISESNFYVLTTSYRIYKCIVSSGNISLIQPDHILPGPVEYSDGYQWQLLYEIPISERVKFLTEDYIPVRFFSTSGSFDHNGVVDKINVITGGGGYTSVPSVIILGDGVGATASASIENNAIKTITVTNGGEGYTFASVYIIGGGGIGATAEADLVGADLPSKINQTVASYAKSNGAGINVVKIVSGGSGYSNNAKIIVTGDGEGAIFEPIRSTVSNTSGVITGIRIINRGSGYTFAQLSVQDTTGSGANLVPVIEPAGGHGSNIPQELFATTIGISANIETTLTDFFIDNDYRQIGLIKNIKTYNENTLHTEDTGTSCFIVEGISSQADFDDVITTTSGGKFTVVKHLAGTQKYFLHPIIDKIATDDSWINITKGTSGSIIGITFPEISVKSGELIYYKNILPTKRQEGQIEQLKLYLSF